MRISSCLPHIFSSWRVDQLDACFDIGAVLGGGRRIGRANQVHDMSQVATERGRESTLC